MRPIHHSTNEALLGALARLGGVAASAQLREALKVSQPTISRWLAAVGEHVVRMGRGRSVRYGRRRELPGLGGQHEVWQVQPSGQARPVGTLHLLYGEQHWLSHPGAAEEGSFYEGLPPFVADMAPQGFLGRTYTSRHRELALPARLSDWSGDHVLVALLRRGDDCVGDLILGQESMDRWLASAPEPVTVSAYPELARKAAAGEAGSSAGGEQPKFTAYREGRHVLVKFIGGEAGEAAARWRDLLACEALALTTAREAGFASARARILDQDGFRFLEVERFDRIGARGRRGVMSISAADNEYTGVSGNWTQMATALHAARRLSEEDARCVRWLDVFGQLIGNTDRHAGNLAVFTEQDGRLQLAPLYDMLPMSFAPAGTAVVERTWAPAPPTSSSLDVWRGAAEAALSCWERVLESPLVSAQFKALARARRDLVAGMVARILA